MKKALVLLLALLLACAAFARAEETAAKEPDLFDLWDCSGTEKAWLASAVPITEGVLLTSWSVIPENTDHLEVSDGKETWKVEAVMPDSTGLVATVFFEPGDRKPRWGTWSLLPFGSSVSAGSCTVRWGDEWGSRINRRVLSAAPLVLDGIRFLLLALPEQVPLGAPVLTAEGELAGIVAAYYAEGDNRVLLLPADELARVLTEASEKLGGMPGFGDAPEGFLVKADKNLVTFDWTDMVLPERTENQTLYLIVVDAQNSYLNFFPAEKEERTHTMLLTPGRVYMAGIMACESTPDRAPDRFAVVVVPPADKLTAFGFRSVVCAVAEAPEGGVTDDNPPVPVTEVTEELLRSGRAYFYSTSTYRVTENLPDNTLLVTLTDPEGGNYRYESSWIYGPEYMENDTWYIPLTDSGLLSGLDRNGYPRGVYRLDFYVNGEHADTVAFELK